MRSGAGGNSFKYFSKNKLTKLANLIEFERMLMFCLEDCGLWPPGLPFVYATAGQCLLFAGDTHTLICYNRPTSLDR